jgi:hypothetical protein
LYASVKDAVLAGRNLDWTNPEAHVWFVPTDEGKYGYVYFGSDVNEPQGGLNNQGLFFAYTTTEPEQVIPLAEKEDYHADLMKKVIAECATVEEAIAVFDRYNLRFLALNQVLIGDRLGNSAVIESNAVSRMDGTYQILTNFRYSKESSNPDHKPCERYNIAKEMLDSSSSVSVDLFRRILAATHQESFASTIYSYIIDFTSLAIHLYHFHNYENVVTLNLKEELAKGAHFIDMDLLFPKTYAAMGFRRWKSWELENRRQAKTIIDVNLETYDDYVGVYIAADFVEGMRLRIIEDHDRLFLAPAGRSRRELTPESESAFFHISYDGDFALEFTRDDSGDVSGLLYEQDGITITFDRTR